MARALPYRLLVLTLALTVSGCTGQPTSPAAAPSDTATPSPTPSTTSAPASQTPDRFVAEASPVAAADLPHSWRPGCPVGPEKLRLLRLHHWGFDDRSHVGTLVVHQDVAADVIEVFRVLYAKRFPIRSLQPVDVYGGSDDASMAADNTSGFNCRNAVAAGPPRWSRHAYGKAIDVNPVENPYLFGGKVLPPAGAAYVDRSAVRPGMAVPGGPLVKAFESVGWRWAGTRRSAPDYQHFSPTGG